MFEFCIFLLFFFLVNHGGCTQTLPISWTHRFYNTDFNQENTTLGHRVYNLPIDAKNVGRCRSCHARIDATAWSDSPIWQQTRESAIIIKLNKLKLIDDKSIRFQFLLVFVLNCALESIYEVHRGRPDLMNE